MMSEGCSSTCSTCMRIAQRLAHIAHIHITYNMNTYDNWGDVSLSSCNAKSKAVGEIRDKACKLELVTCQTVLVVEPLP